MSLFRPKMVCGVCGDRAIAQNFGVPSCESCKAFFRRNADRVDIFKCAYGEQCQLTVLTRRRCRRCRINKCYEIGMKKEWIWNESQKQERVVKVEENRKRKECRKLEKMADKDSTDSADPSGSSGEDCPNLDDNSSLTTIDLKEVDWNLLDIRTEQFSSALVPVSRPIADYNNTLNELESSRLTELLEATKYLTVELPSPTAEVTNIADGLRLASHHWDREIRKIIKTAKKLMAFNNICEQDKMTLLKYASVEIALMRSIACFDMQSQSWTWAKSDKESALINLEVFKQKSVDAYESYKWFFGNLGRELEMDYNILHMLFAIVLFCTNRPQLIHKHQIRFQQQVYMHLLKRYLQLRYQSESEANARFYRLTAILRDLYYVHHKYVRMCLDERPDLAPNFLVSPLLKELYDKQDVQDMAHTDRTV